MSTKNLTNDASWKKLRDLIDDIKIGMMLTGFDKKPISAVPMSTKKVDKDGNIWFLSLETSEHNQDLMTRKDIQLLYSKPSEMEFLSVYGHAEVTKDRIILEDLYNKVTDGNWFDGVDDPKLTAIKVKPEEAHYWDSDSNKYVSLLKMGIGAVTGDKQDVGDKGKLNL